MKAVILAGGLGTRISEESHLKPKPMIEIGGKPILWHIMKIYSAHGVNEFVICLGYKGYIIKEFFADYYLHMSDVTFDLARNAMRVHKNTSEDWNVTLVDTGLETMTGGRVKRIKEFVGNDDFFLTYGDGVADVDIGALKAFHKGHGKIATITMVSVPQRFGVIDMTDAGDVTQFKEKSNEDAHRINGGFMVLSPKVFNYIEGDTTVLEREPLENLAADGQLMAYRHEGFWQCMDTQRDKQLLDKLLEEGNAPWMKWD
jgi:glucose-1-phosphate cytidylyltransferase